MSIKTLLLTNINLPLIVFFFCLDKKFNTKMFSKRKTVTMSVEDKCNKLKNDYPHDIQMYIQVPTDVLDLQEFKKLAMERRESNNSN